MSKLARADHAANVRKHLSWMPATRETREALAALDALEADLAKAERERDEWRRAASLAANDAARLRRRPPTDEEVWSLPDAAKLEADLAAYQRSLMAHHEISTLSQAAIRESIGGPCQICARAQAIALAALAELEADLAACSCTRSQTCPVHGWGLAIDMQEAAREQQAEADV